MDIPPVIATAIRRGAVVAVSVSGGKDSQAMERVLVRLHQEQGWPGACFAVHADIGQPFDWPWTIPLCRRNARALGHPLHIVLRADRRTLLDLIQRRLDRTRGTGKPPFPSMACRYCTSESKTAPIDVLLRRSGDLIICAVGLRAEESPRRANQPAVSVRKAISAKRLKQLSPEEALEAWRPGKERLGLTWNPILAWTIDQVWSACGTSQAELDARRDLFHLGCYEMAFGGWPCSPTYLWQSRHSCAICIFGSRADIQAGVRYKPELRQAIVRMEQESGFAWQQGHPISTIQIQPVRIPAAAHLIQPLP